MAFRDLILPALDATRAIGGRLGLRVFQVKVRLRTWSGIRVGLGNKTDTDTILTNQGLDGVVQNVIVRQVSRREAIASGGVYTDRDLRVGPITPPYSAAFQMAAAGTNDSVMDPQFTSTPTEIFWIVSSSNGIFGYPPGGVLCEKIGEEAKALHTYVILRATGAKP